MIHCGFVTHAHVGLRALAIFTARLNVSIDNDTDDQIREAVWRYRTTKTIIVRLALRYLLRQVRAGKIKLGGRDNETETEGNNGGQENE